MKSIKEKARAYDEALTVAKQWYNDSDTTKKEKNLLKGMFSELKESEDERIRKEIKDFFSRIMLGQENFLKEDYDWNAWIAWLEKQGEQKPADKVEPKFHEGEWVVTDKNNVVQIKAIEDSKYVLENTMRFSVDYVDKCWRKWTIQDAKDGDVLVVNNEVFIYAHRKQMYSIVVSHCYVDSAGGFYLDGEFGYTEKGNPIHPATKEQRELLFQNMKEAGYEWNPDTKELKKTEKKSATMSLDEAIEHCKEKSCGNNACALEHKQLENWLTELKELKEHKPAWSEEDDQYLLVCKNALAKYQVSDKWDATIISRWLEDKLKSLKDRVQPKWEWSEEDEEHLNSIISSIKTDMGAYPRLPEVVDDYNNDISWLKSLKDRYTWKPSDRDIKLLKELSDGKICPDNYRTRLYEIINNLKYL